MTDIEVIEETPKPATELLVPKPVAGGTLAFYSHDGDTWAQATPIYPAGACCAACAAWQNRTAIPTGNRWYPVKEIEMAPIDEAVSDLKLALEALEDSDQAEKDRSYDNVIRELNSIRHLADELYGAE